MKLLIPVDGLVQVRTSDQPVEEVLAANGGRGPLACITMEVDNRPVGKCWFLHDVEAPQNPRALDGMAALTSVYVAFRGPVLMTDLEEKDVIDLLSFLDHDPHHDPRS